MFVELELEQVGLAVEVDPDDTTGPKTLAYGDGSKWKVHMHLHARLVNV